MADWNLQGKPDLIGVKKSGGASTEVHIYSGESNFQADIEHTATPLQPTNALWTFQAGDFNNDAIPDLFAIATQNTGSGMTEAHILSGARDGNGNEFQTWLLHAALPLGYVNPYVTAFAVADWDRNGNADLFVIAKQGVSSTEVHALAG